MLQLLIFEILSYQTPYKRLMQIETELVGEVEEETKIPLQVLSTRYHYNIGHYFGKFFPRSF